MHFPIEGIRLQKTEARSDERAISPVSLPENHFQAEIVQISTGLIAVGETLSEMTQPFDHTGESVVLRFALVLELQVGFFQLIEKFRNEFLETLLSMSARGRVRSALTRIGAKYFFTVA